MKTTLISLFAFAVIFSSCDNVNKVGQFKAVASGQPISIGYESSLQLKPGDKVYLHDYTNGWALAAPDDTSGVLALFVNEIQKPAGVFAGNKTGQFKSVKGQHFSIGYDANLQLTEGEEVYLHEYTNGWALAAPDDTLGVKAVFVK